jgi:hypothetical protein
MILITYHQGVLYVLRKIDESYLWIWVKFDFILIFDSAWEGFAALRLLNGFTTF